MLALLCFFLFKTFTTSCGNIFDPKNAFFVYLVVFSRILMFAWKVRIAFVIQNFTSKRSAFAMLSSCAKFLQSHQKAPRAVVPGYAKRNLRNSIKSVFCHNIIHIAKRYSILFCLLNVNF